MKLLNAIWLFCIALSVYAGSPGQIQIQQYAFESVAKAVIVVISEESALGANQLTIDADALILSLGYSKNPLSENSLIDLLDFYLGESHYQALGHSITKGGTKYKAKLKARLNLPPTCLGFDQSELKLLKKSFVRCLDKEERDKRISHLIKLINMGQVVEYVF